MIPVDYDFMPPAVRAGWEIPFDLPDWTAFNLVPGGGPAASAYTRLMFGGQYFDVNDKKAAYAEMRFCMQSIGGVNGAAMGRLSCITPSGWVHSNPVVTTATPSNQQNVGQDVTAFVNGLIAETQVCQFTVMLKGKGAIAMARLQVDWRVTHVVPA